MGTTTKVIISDQATDSYWGVWYDIKDKDTFGNPDELLCNGTAWLMWCPSELNPSVNDSWGHAEEIDDSCRNVLDVIESVYKVSFHESIWVDIPATETPSVCGGCGETYPVCYCVDIPAEQKNL